MDNEDIDNEEKDNEEKDIEDKDNGSPPVDLSCCGFLKLLRQRTLSLRPGERRQSWSPRRGPGGGRSQSRSQPLSLPHHLHGGSADIAMALKFSGKVCMKKTTEVRRWILGYGFKASGRALKDTKFDLTKRRCLSGPFQSL